MNISLLLSKIAPRSTVQAAVMAALALPLILVSPSSRAQNAGRPGEMPPALPANAFLPQLPAQAIQRCEDCEVSVLALDLSRPPTEAELIACGGMGGALSPTNSADVQTWIQAGGSPQQIARLQAINLSFGHAMQKWNMHQYRAAAAMLAEHVRDFPDSPWAGEAKLHLGCDARYNGRFSESQAYYEDILNTTSGDPTHPGYDIHQKAKLRWAELDASMGRWPEAADKMTNLLQTDRDWRRLTWARHWLRNINMYQGNARQLRACGTEALSVVLASLDKKQAAAQLAQMKPPRDDGFSLAELTRLARRYGSPMHGFRGRANQLAELPMPLIIHWDYSRLGTAGFETASPVTQGKGRPQPKNSASKWQAKSPAGHFLVVTAVDAAKGIVSLYDPQEKRPYALSYAALDREWSGTGLVLEKPGRKGGRLKTARLSDAEAQQIIGGCCGVQRKEEELGNSPFLQPCDGPSCDGLGAPTFGVNRINLNLFVQDTPLWYETPIGPDMAITLSYNSQDSTNQNNVFGNKWSFNYGSYVTLDPGSNTGRMLVIMPDGSKYFYTPNSSGGYDPEKGVFHTLRKTLGYSNRWELTSPYGDKFIYDLPVGTTSLQQSLVEVRDRWGQSVRIKHDPQGRPGYIEDALGNRITLTYTNNRVTRVTDPFGRYATFTYTNGNLTGVTDMGGLAFSYAYDSQVRLTQLNAPQGSWQFKHEGPDGSTAGYYPPPDAPMWQNMRLTITDPAGKKEEFYYDGYTGFTQSGQPGYSWHVNKNHYVAYGQIVNGTVTNNGMAAVPKTKWVQNTVIDGKGKIGEIRLPNGDTEYYTYDPNNGFVSSLTNARVKGTSLVYNDQGQVTSITRPNGQLSGATPGAKTVIDYDPYNKVDVSSVHNELGQMVVIYENYVQHQPRNISVLNDSGTYDGTTITYTSWGAVASVQDATGTTTYNYGPPTGTYPYQLTSISRAGVTLDTFTYDAIGRVLTHTDAAGVALTYSYNNLDRVTRVTYPNGTHADFEYACCGQLTAATDRAGRRTSYQYDALNRVKKVFEAAHTATPLVTEVLYDNEGNLKELKDSKLNVTKWDYDARNRAIKKTFPDLKFETYGYDGNSNLTQVIDARGQAAAYTTAYTYDDNDNLKLINYPATSDVSFTYDAADRPLSMTDGIGTTGFSHDPQGRLTAADGPWAADTVSYTYDALGRRRTMSVPNGAVTDSLTYNYDALSRLTSIVSPLGTFGYGYAGNSEVLTRLQRPNGGLTTNSYDGLMRLITTRSYQSDGVTNISKYTYGPDVRDIRASLQRTVGAEAMQHINYGYNAVDELTSEISTEATPLLNQRYNYDAVGNRLNMASGPVATPDESISYVINSLNQYTSYSTTAGGTTATTSLTYDNRGNVLSQGRWRYAYDDANRLIQVVRLHPTSLANEWASNFSYDGLNRKRRIVEYSWNASSGVWVQQSDRRTLYDGMTEIQERNGSNGVTASYTRGLDMGGGIGGLLARSVPGVGSFYYHYDGSGNVVQLTDAVTQATVARYDYDAFGNLLAWSGPQTVQPYRFSSKAQHSNSGLIDFGFRFYSPELGRFLNRDPIGEAGGVNLYGFVGNSPTNLVDTNGLWPSEMQWWEQPGNWLDKNALGGKAGRAGHDWGMAESGYGSLDTALSSSRDAALGVTELSVGIYGAGKAVGALAKGGGGIACTAKTPDKLTWKDKRYIIRTWSKGMSRTRARAAKYHYGKHGRGEGILTYTRKGVRYWHEYKHRARPHILDDGSEGLKITTSDHFGIYTKEGKLISHGPQ